MKANIFKRLILASALLLTGCGNQVSSFSSSTASSSSQPTISSNEPSLDISSMEESSATDSSSSYILDGSWDEELIQLMEEKFHYVLPYLGFESVSYAYHASFGNDLPKITITYRDSDLDQQAALERMKKVLESDGWTYSSDSGITFSKESVYLSLQVTFGYGVQFVLTYDEPCDPTSITDWRDDEKVLMRQYFDDHEIPFVYLGTTLYEIDWKINSFEVTGNWDDSLLALTKKTLRNDSWNVNSYTNSSSGTQLLQNSTYLTATKEFDDECFVEITFGETRRLASYLSVSIEMPFDSENYDYPEEIKNQMNFYLDDHANEIPVIYLGTSFPRYQYRESAQCFSQYYIYNSKVYDLALSLLEEKDFTIYTSGTIVDGDKTITGYKDFSDQCQLRIKIYPSGQAIYLEFFICEWKPEENTSYDQETSDHLNEDFPNISIPYVYLCKDTVSYYYSKNNNTASLRGGGMSSSFLTYTEEKLTSDGFVVTQIEKGYAEYGLSAKKDMGNGFTLCLIIYKEYLGITCLDISYDENWNPDSYSYSQAALNYFSLHFHGHEDKIPVIYLGTKTPTEKENDGGSGYYFSSKSKEDQVLSLAKTRLEEAGYTITELEGCLSATLDFEDGCQISISVDSYVSSFLTSQYCSIQFRRWDPTSYTQWSDEIKNDFSSLGTDIEVPVIYLGTETPTLKEGHVLIGGLSDERLITESKTVPEDSGYTVFEENKTSLSASLDWNEDSYLVITVYQYLGHCCLTVSLHEVWDPTSCSSWNNAVLNEFNAAFGFNNSIPYVYMGTSNPTVINNTYSGYSMIYGEIYNDDYLTQAYDAFKDLDDWEVTRSDDESIYSPFASADRVIATKTLTTGKTITLEFGKSDTTWTLQSRCFIRGILK